MDEMIRMVDRDGDGQASRAYCDYVRDALHTQHGVGRAC